ncbi:N-acetylmuramoyl-L-alanine amidase [Rubritalea marina]|uniref:N-acetylmuramoyl-L-alanine amidase n=1 Tax=Rubritalea marina TaxID=361055 RepID=UPI0014617015|nr:N-acetylmuramoyl-L-alanine amidase [Rubritalea marina]
MNRKKIAFESALIVLALVAAFLVQLVISHTRPPKMPDFDREDELAEKQVVTTTAPIPKEESWNTQQVAEVSNIPAIFNPHVSSLGIEPDWTSLDVYQEKITKKAFREMLTKVYVKGEFWRRWFYFSDKHVDILTSAGDLSQSYRLHFKIDDGVSSMDTAPRYWRSKEQLNELGDLDSDLQPLKGIRIVIDPGHIGGAYAQMEERNFILSEEFPPVQEGNMTMIVAEMLQRQLETLGAKVSLTRVSNAPVNPNEVEDYLPYAQSKLEQNGAIRSQMTVTKEAERLFYRNGEIRARADEVNRVMKPDVVLCVHFNASAQPDPDTPILEDNEHFHVLVNGAYTESELAHDDERYQCVLRILQEIHTEELRLAKHLVDSFVEETQLPAYEYNYNSKRAVNLGDSPFIWGRNLLANRIFTCPVIFLEPYLMNGADSFYRMQAGGYQGLRFVNGKLRPSIYKEYTDAVVKGLVSYYTIEDDSVVEVIESAQGLDAELRSAEVEQVEANHSPEEEVQ